MLNINIDMHKGTAVAGSVYGRMLGKRNSWRRVAVRSINGAAYVWRLEAVRYELAVLYELYVEGEWRKI